MICDRVYHAVSLFLFLLNQAALLGTAILLRHHHLSLLFVFIAISAASIGVNLTSACWTFADRSKSNRVNSIFVHCLLLAMPWRYVNLVKQSDKLPSAIRLSTVEVCLLRLQHSAIASLPIVCLHLHAVLDQEMSTRTAHLVCIGVSLVDLCWAAASVSRKTSRTSPERMILSWPGIIAQTCWRLGTISSRLIVLIAFTVSYDSLIVAVISLQWLLMVVAHLLLFTSEDWQSASKCRPQQLLITCAVSLVFVIDYFTFSTHNRTKMVVYYVLRFVENCFLLALCFQHQYWHRSRLLLPITASVLGGYGIGVLSLLIYHSCLHVNRMMSSISATPDNGFVCRLPFQVRRKLPSKFEALDTSQSANSFTNTDTVKSEKAEVETRF